MMVVGVNQGERIVNFNLTEDEEMLKAVAERFVRDHYDHESRRSFQAEAPGFSVANWCTLGEIGLLAAPLPQEHGGFDIGATGIATMCEALGYGLVVEPVAEAIVLAGRLLLAGAGEELREDWAAALVSGDKRVALAHAERDYRDGACWVRSTARSNGNMVILDGEKPFCITGSGADAYIVSARSSGTPDDPHGVDFYLVPAETPELTIKDWPMIDGTYATKLHFSDMAVPIAARLNGGFARLTEIELLASLARSSEALGIMRRLFADTTDYLRTRTQFGAPIGSFQAIQHRMVTQYAAIEQSRALINLALVSAEPAAFARAVYGARAYIAEVSVELGHEMIQFHGGMGVTDELAIGAGHMRLLMLSRWPESPLATLDRFAAAEGPIEYDLAL
ncbi:acyl-CoA dehydrogenase family protein [Sphingomonas sp.]|uniref:acyl-CoA dehydrogenase family protein n=1 Tax=Sphingomonas sp. TaxID=28214 RepID=UPI00333F4DE5